MFFNPNLVKTNIYCSLLHQGWAGNIVILVIESVRPHGKCCVNFISYQILFKFNKDFGLIPCS